MTKRKMNIEYCGMTGKQKFDRKAQAERVAYRMKKRAHCKTYGSVYMCEYCGKYHVTHYSYERSRAFRTDKNKRLNQLIET